MNLNRYKIRRISPRSKENELGAGVNIKNKNFVTHTVLDPSNSAAVTFVWWQKIVIFAIISLLFLGVYIDPLKTGIFVVTVVSFIYFIDLLFTVFILFRSLNKPPEVKFRKSQLKAIDNDDLPVYSILCPLYKEAEVLPQFTKAIESIDWPKEKLDVLLLLEEDDQKTIEKAKELNLPSYFRIFVVPDSLPKTKPKACNYGLAYAKGKYVVIYDAEDKPDPLQLKKAYLAFSKLPKNIVCLQSKLNYYNTDQNLLTRMFTAEYSLWFDLVLPGLQSINTTIPLGGTSNHFKKRKLDELHGWDPFNVTEDCDLGARLFKRGYKTAIIDSTTYEEANSVLKSWFRQRSRWIKGYLQTYLVHTREPFAFLREFGIHSLVFQLVIGARMLFILINPLLWVITISYFTLTQTVGPTIEALYPPHVFYIAVFSLVFGNFIYLYNYMIGTMNRENWHLVKFIFFIPFYWVLSSVAAVIAFYQLVRKPFFWEKTKHGLHLQQAPAEKVELPSLSLVPNFGFVLLPFKFSSKLIFIISRTIGDFVGLLKNLTPDDAGGFTKRKILIFNWRDTAHIWAGGAEVYVQEVAKRWVDSGNSVTVFCGWDGRNKREETVDGVRIIRRGGFYTVYPLAIIYYLLKFRGRFDAVVDCENGIPFFTPLFVRIPKILLIHHVHQEVFRQYLFYPLAKLAMFLESSLMPFLYSKVQVVTISRSSKKEIIDKDFAEDDRISVIEPGIHKKLYGTHPKTAYPSFSYLGRLKPWKNVDVAIKAFSQIVKKYQNAKFYVAGFGETREQLERLAKKLNISDKIEFLGKVSDADRTRILAKSWVAIQPSSYEGWGITVIEANACGTPVLASDINGLKDSVLDNRTGMLFPLKNERKLANLMMRIIDDGELRGYLTEEALFWSKSYTWEYTAIKFLKVIDDSLTKYEFRPAYEYLQRK